MDNEELERKLRNYFINEVKRAEPREAYWQNAILQSIKRVPVPSPAKIFYIRLHPSQVSIVLSLFLAIVLVGGFLPMLGGMAPPPPPAPVAVPDGAGGAFLVWTDRPYSQFKAAVYAQHITAQGSLLWEKEGKLIAGENSNLCGAISDGASGIIIAWEKAGSNFLERIENTGNIIWKLECPGARQLIGMAEDGVGGTIILSYDNGGGLYAQRVDGSGTILWGQEGLRVGYMGVNYPVAFITGGGEGKSVVLWVDDSNRVMTLRVQLVGMGGELLWGNEGVGIAAVSDGRICQAQIICDRTGGFFVVWNSEGASLSESDVYLQKLDENGNPLWGNGGVKVCPEEPVEGENPIGGLKSRPAIVSDGNGGVIVTWCDRRQIYNGEIFAQRFNAGGEMLWDVKGVRVWDIPENYPKTAGTIDSCLISDGDGGAVVVWTGYGSSSYRNTKIYTQHLDQDGRRLWPAQELYNNPSFRAQGYSNAIEDGQGGVIIVSRVGESSSISQTHSIYAQRISSGGERFWGEGGKEVYRFISAPTVQVIAFVATLAAAALAFGLFRRNKIAEAFTAVLPVLFGIAGLFCLILVIGSLGYSYSWAYVPDTVLNKTAALLVPLIGLVTGIISLIKRLVTRWITVPVTVFCAFIVAISILLMIAI